MSNEDLPLFDREDALNRLGGSQDLLKTLLTSYQMQYKDAVEHARQLFIQNKETDAMREIHTLKSVTGNLGLSRLYLTIMETERTIKKEGYQANKHLPLIDQLVELNRQTINVILEENI